MGSDKDYFLIRAEEEQAKAAESNNEAAQEAHLRLAEFYRQTAQKRGPKALGENQLGSSELFIL